MDQAWTHLEMCLKASGSHGRLKTVEQLLSSFSTREKTSLVEIMFWQSHAIAAWLLVTDCWKNHESHEWQSYESYECDFAWCCSEGWCIARGRSKIEGVHRTRPGCADESDESLMFEPFKLCAGRECRRKIPQMPRNSTIWTLLGQKLMQHASFQAGFSWFYYFSLCVFRLQEWLGCKRLPFCFKLYK